MIAQCAGHAIGYDETGAGIPLVLLHGFPHDRTIWAPQLAALAQQARCIAPDLRGFGESGRAGPFSVDQYADDVACLMDELGVDRAVIAGLSMGGYVAFALRRRHPRRVRGLVLASTRAGADDDAAREKRRELIALAQDAGAEAVADRVLEGMVGKTTRARAPETVALVRGVLARAPVEGVVGALHAMMERPDSTPDLATIAVPTLLIAGDEDVLTPLREARAMHGQIPRSRLEVIAGAGHLTNLERPAAFNHLLREFLTAQSLA